MKEQNRPHINFLGWITVLVAVAGAMVSLYFMFYEGRNQPSILLIIFFAIWVLSPFIGFLVLNNVSSRWAVTVRETLYWLAIIVTILSVTGYSGLFNIPGAKTAFPFLVIPFVSWLVIITSFFIARRMSKKKP